MTAAGLLTPTLGESYRSSHRRLYVETLVRSELPDVKPLSQYETDPVGFFVKVLGVWEHRIRWSMNPGYDRHAWDGTIDPIVAAAESLAKGRDVAIESATGTGKSFGLAMINLWFAGSFYEARGFSFAPKEEQLRAFMWMELGKLWPRFHLYFPTAVLTDLRLRMRGPRDAAWGLQGYSVGKRAGEEVSVAAQGMHAIHQLLSYEETPGIQHAVIEAGLNTSTADHNLRIAVGNPDNQLDALHLFGHDNLGAPRPDIEVIRISALDHPNVVSRDGTLVPGAVSQRSITRRTAKYTTDGRLYKSRIRGLSPAEAVDALIKLEWIRAAQKRWANEDDKRVLTANGKAKKALGADVADSEDGDDAAISRWTGAYCHEVVAQRCPDANVFGADLADEMRRDDIDDERVGVDAVGVGAGAVNELKRLNRYVVALGRKQQQAEDGEIVAISGEEVVAEERFNTPRSRWYWRLREDLRHGNIALPPSPTLAQDLITPRWGTHNGEIWVESKEDLKKRLPGGRSPNEGDAVVYGNWVRDRSPMVSKLPKKALTLAQRLQREMEKMDRDEKRQRDAERGKTTVSKYGKVLRQ